MIVVYKVTHPDQQVTHLHLPTTPWGNTVRERLVHQGYVVEATDRDQWPDTRDAAERARRDALLEWASPD